MKVVSCYTIFITSLLCSMIFSNPGYTAGINIPPKKNLRLITLHYENSSGEEGVTSFEYDEYGIMYKAKWELLDSSRYSLNYYTFDKNGNMIQKYREFSDGITSNVIYKYDGNENMIAEYFERSDGVTGNVKYLYNTSGSLVQAECEGLNGWFYGKLLFKHDDNGRKASAVIEQKGNKVGGISYDYDSEGNLVKEHWDFSGEWNQTFIYEYEEYKKHFPKHFTSSNVFIANTGKYQLVKETYNFNDSIGGPSFFRYDRTNKLVKKIFERSDGMKTETTFIYDENGILKKSKRIYSNGDSAKFTYEFNGNRKLVHKNFEFSDGSKGSEHYEYDGKWNLSKAVYDNFDFWLSGTIIFDYDEKENLNLGHFKGEKFDAEIFIENDENGNLLKVHWEFSFGKTQTYTFQYVKK